MGFLNKLERKFGRYAIHGLMKYVIACYVIGYVIMYMAQASQPMATLYNCLQLEPYYILHGQIWRIVSWVLIPPSRSNIIFVVIMLVLYYQLGTALENTWGAFRFNLYIFGGVIYSVIGAFALYGIYSAIYGMPITGIGSAFSTYYINMTIFLAFAVCYPNMQVMLYFLIPIKMKWMAIVYAVLMAWEFFTTNAPGRVAILCSVLNFLIFFFSTRNYKQFSPHEIKRKKNFKEQVKQPKGITKHKCAICGRTEQDDPNLQFRFCSKCNGNYEYCQYHLFTHQHINK